MITGRVAGISPLENALREAVTLAEAERAAVRELVNATRRGWLGRGLAR